MEAMENRTVENSVEKESRVFEAVGTRVLGPALNGFIVWVLKNAVKDGKKRLYFLARDGYFMFRAAKLYAEKFALPVECRYLSCSRYSLRLPMFHLDKEEAMDYICRDSIGVNLTRIMNRAGLEREEQGRVLEEIKAVGGENNPIPYVSLEETKRKLAASTAFMEALVRHSREAMPALAGYLSQEGLLEGKKEGKEDALVDSGWVGSMQKTLNRLLKHMGREKELEGYYWGLYELPPGVAREQYHCYYFSPEGQLRRKVYFNNNLFEAVFSAPHGMTIAYEERDGRYAPVYTSVTDERRKQMQRLEGSLLRYVREASEALRDIDSADCRREKRRMAPLLKRFMGKPTREEAEVFGRMFFCDDVLEYAHHPLAELMTEKELRANHAINKILVMTGLRKEEIEESAWFEGSAVMSSERPGRHLFWYGIYKYLLHIRQMYMWRKSNGRKKDR